MADFESLKQMIVDGDDGATAATQQLVDSGASARDILDHVAPARHGRRRRRR